MRVKILVIEDNEDLNNNLVDILTFEGYEVLGVTNFDSSKKVFNEFNPDIILIDVMLPGGNGYDLIPYFRQKNDIRLIMISALNDIEIKKKSYCKGADDYITKPFEIDELVLKIAALKRRILAGHGLYHFGPMTLNTRENVLTYKDRKTELTPVLTQTMEVLVKNYLDNPSHPKVLEVNQYNKRSIQTAINRIRREFEAFGLYEIGVKSIYGEGYILVMKYD